MGASNKEEGEEGCTLYSRKFNSGEMSLPPDYGGVAYRQNERRERPGKEEETGRERQGRTGKEEQYFSEEYAKRESYTDIPSKNRQNGPGYGGGSSVREPLRDDDPENCRTSPAGVPLRAEQGEDRRPRSSSPYPEEQEVPFRRAYSRRPLYYDTEDPGSWEGRPPREAPEKEKTDKGGGLLSGLLSFKGKRFSVEDIVLAGLILMMLSDRDDGREPDGQMLLILGLLLLTG